MKKNEIIALKVEKRKYFCIVKRLTINFRTIVKTVIITVTVYFLCVSAHGSTPGQHADLNADTTSDSIEVSLLTCSSGEEVYSLYGHTALRYHNLHNGEDWTFNYGIFSFKKPFFVLRFTMGITDYELGVIPFNIFKREYARTGRGVVEQVLNMTAEEKQTLYNALIENYSPENRVYRYNFFYNNCTTKVRDMIEHCLKGNIVYPEESSYPTYREAIHEYTVGHPWATFGNDLCIGAKADMAMSLREQQFLPDNLKNDFEKARIKSADGEYKPLVTDTRTIIEPQIQIIEKEFPFSPTQCAYILLSISIVIAVIEYKRKRTFIAWDSLIMLTDGIAGIILTVLLFSKHPTTSTNLQVLLINPLPLIYIYNVIKRRKTIYWKFSFTLIVLFFIGAFFQNYAGGINIVALSLLIRCWINMRLSASPTSNK